MGRTGCCRRRVELQEEGAGCQGTSRAQPGKGEGQGVREPQVGTQTGRQEPEPRRGAESRPGPAGGRGPPTPTGASPGSLW